MLGREIYRFGFLWVRPGGWPRRGLGVLMALGLSTVWIQGEPAPEEAPTEKSEPLVIDITGEEFEWHIRYPGPDGKPGTPDDILTRRHLHLPVDTDIRLELHSKDYVYSLALPHLELNEIAVPDLTFIMEFKTEREGTYELLGDQMCGYTHPKLMGEMVVLSKEAFEAWSEKTGAES